MASRTARPSPNTGRAYASVSSRAPAASEEPGGLFGCGEGSGVGHNIGVQYRLTAHARAVSVERAIEMVWVEQTLQQPEKIEDDRMDKNLRHALKRIAERGGRALRVVYDPRLEPWLIITAYFDRRKGHEGPL